ncbi:hypothetical protein M405DRAFT_764030 [Rhizopogon salebrosus TDB-379]|nr:hypothetical protein M405DRAFT_764030 [Rhizopogon salebrosus TDB-379]
MSVTVVEDGPPKKLKESKFADSRADPNEVRAKPKKRKHREATSDVLPINPHKDQAPAAQDSGACDPSPPSVSSADSGNVASKHAHSHSATGHSEGSPKKEKNKRHSGDVVREQSKDASKGDESRKEKKEKRKKKQHSDEGKKEAATKSDDTRVQTIGEPTSDKLQHKKRKRSAEEQLEDSLSANKPRKKKKDHCSTDVLFPDPSSDESLSDQSRKALSYAYARFQDPPNWKFNKARQIWLIKKLWSEEMASFSSAFVGLLIAGFLFQIPEKYFALVTTYLADVKGGIRDTLIQMCNSEIASVTTDTSVESIPETADLSNGGGSATTKVMRARSLVDSLSRVE